MRGLILLRGMSFRDGTRGTRSYGNDFAVDSQKEATLSHLKLYHHLKNTYNIDVKTLKVKVSRHFLPFFNNKKSL